MAISVIALYFWVFFSVTKISSSLTVSLPSLTLAGVTAIVCFISYLWPPKKTIFPITLAVYLLLATTTAVLIVGTGGSSSPFIALLMLIGIFSGIFGIWGSLPILLAAGAFIASQYMANNLTSEVIIMVAFSSLLPLIASFIIWHDKSRKDESGSENKAYRNLANELTEVTSKSEVVINAIGDGVMAIDSQGIIRLINPAAQQIIGWGKQDALALNYKSVLQLTNQKNETLDSTSDPIQQVLNINQQIRTNDLVLVANGGSKLMISLVVSPVGEIGSGVIAVFHDITKEKAEDREQAEFISTASHEMRTPVASIEGYMGLALNPQTAQIDDRAREFILKAHASAEHLGHLFQDLLDVSKAEDGRLSNNPKVVNIITFVREVVQGLEQKATDKNLQLVYKPIPDSPNEKNIVPVFSVNADNDHIREIINNLVENAIKYTTKGDIIVDVTGDDNHVVISVKDNGIGIPAENMAHLFQKFYRVDNKDTHDIGGTGLGLYLSRRLAEIMGGRIWAESSYGKGSTFYCELPRISNQEATELIEQENIKAKQETEKLAALKSEQATVTTTSNPTAQEPAQEQTKTAKPTHSVPRGEALTPEQIAAYVAQQHELAQQKEETKPVGEAVPIVTPTEEHK